MEYEPDFHGMHELLISPWCYGVLHEHATRVANYARSVAPVGKPPEDRHPGLYKESIHIVNATSFKGTRARVDVVAEVPYAQRVEAKYHVLSRALDAAKGAD